VDGGSPAGDNRHPQAELARPPTALLASSISDVLQLMTDKPVSASTSGSGLLGKQGGTAKSSFVPVGRRFLFSDYRSRSKNDT